MKNVLANARFWMGGTVIAFAGVVLARFVAPALPPGALRLTATIGGQLIAIAGLALICVGVSRRVRRTSDESPPRNP